MDIDLVLPYVDGSDPVWLEQYAAVIGDTPDSSRFQPNPYLKYTFRGIAENMPFFRNIYFVVSNESQIPSWLNRNSVTIVYHKDFIPASYLPLFNSAALDLFFYLIPGLSEHYIYANDDWYALQTMSAADFFTDDGTPIVYMEELFNVGQWTNRVMEWTKMFYEPYPSTCRAPAHIFISQTKTLWQDVWNDFHDILANSISKVRKNETDINQYCETYYAWKRNKIKTQYFPYAYYPAIDRYGEIIPIEVERSIRKALCINDIHHGGLNALYTTKLNNAFARKFPIKCKYEL